MKKIFSLVTMTLAGCATGPKCGDLAQARTVYVQAKSCEIRIRQVTIGSELKIPESLKRPDLAGMELQWVEPGVIGGQVILGHFILAPRSQNEGRRR